MCVLADKSQLQREAWFGFCFLCCACWKGREARGRIFLAGCCERKEAGRATALSVQMAYTKPLASDTVTEAFPADRRELVCSGVCTCMCVHVSACVHKSEISLYLQEESESCFVAAEFHVQPAAKQAMLWNLPGLCLSFHSENITPKGRGSGLDKIRLDLSICPELKPSVCLPEFSAFDKAQIISLATCPASSMSALYSSTRKHKSILKQAMHAASELVRSRNLKT